MPQAHSPTPHLCADVKQLQSLQQQLSAALRYATSSVAPTDMHIHTPACDQGAHANARQQSTIGRLSNMQPQPQAALHGTPAGVHAGDPEAAGKRAQQVEALQLPQSSQFNNLFDDCLRLASTGEGCRD